MTSAPSTSASSSKPAITPRDIDFDLDPSAAKNWLDGSEEKTLFLNALSIMFPPGERFFISSVLGNRSLVTDAALKDQIKDFCRQEGYHTREHIAYNRALCSFIDADKLDSELARFLAMVKKFTPKGDPLLVTCALEHFTAIMAHALLEDARYLKNANSSYERLWVWHALEECEHKAVAFDVFRATVKNPFREYDRMFIMAMTTLIFYAFIFKHIVLMMKAQHMLLKPRSWAKLLWSMFGNPGMMRRIASPWAKYFSPSFHPNDIDDSAALARTRAVVGSWTTATLDPVGLA